MAPDPVLVCKLVVDAAAISPLKSPPLCAVEVGDGDDVPRRSGLLVTFLNSGILFRKLRGLEGVGGGSTGTLLEPGILPMTPILLVDMPNSSLSNPSPELCTGLGFGKKVIGLRLAVLLVPKLLFRACQWTFELEFEDEVLTLAFVLWFALVGVLRLAEACG